MFSISTVASSTSTPTASASPPSVMTLMVCPSARITSAAPMTDSGMETTTMKRAAPAAEEHQDHRGRERAAMSPSVSSPSIARVTKPD